MKTYISKVVSGLYPELIGREDDIMGYYKKNQSDIDKKIKKLV
jgi:hypothetical protein